MKRLSLFLAACAFLFLAACSSIGQQKAVTPEDNLRYGQAVMTGIYTTLGDAAEQQTLPAADARKYFNQVGEAKKYLDDVDVVVRGLPKGAAIPADALGKINLALAILTPMAAELQKRLPPAATKAIPAAKP